MAKNKKISLSDVNWLLSILLIVSWVITTIGVIKIDFWFIHLHYLGLWKISNEDLLTFSPNFVRYARPFLLFGLLWRIMTWLNNRSVIGWFIPEVQHFMVVLPAVIHAIITLVLVQFDSSNVYVISDYIMELFGSDVTGLVGLGSMILAIITLAFPPKKKRDLS